MTAAERGLFIAGTDTGVGKTAIGGVLARLLTGQGVTVRARKPAESGCKRDEQGRLHPLDAARLREAAGAREPLPTICPFPFEPAVSTERAARLAGTRLTLDELAAACRAGVAAGDFLLVEGAGGCLSPMAERATVADLARALGLPVLLVAPDRLGCLNQVLLCHEALAARGLRCAAVALNRLSPAHPAELDNLDDLRRWLPVPVIALPYEAEVAAVLPPDWSAPLSAILATLR
jgi:dethiobiotin synthetase